MEDSYNLERRRSERRRRERLRKKRIRAVFLIICIVVLIVFGIIAFVSCSSRNRVNVTTIGGTEATVEPADAEAAFPSAEPETEDISAQLGIPAASEENDLLKIIEQADAAGGEKVCYLTFDDGPSQTVTPRILDTLRKYNIKATFFEMGASISENPDMARRVYEEGHLIANHSDSHNYDKLYATEEAFIGEVLENEELINNITGGDHAMKLFRFPGGSYNAGDHAAEKQVYKQTLASNGIYYIDWNTLNGDAEGKKKDANELLEYVKKYTNTSASAVVLMHDAAAKSATADALESIIQYFMSEGYTFKRLDEVQMPAAAPQTDYDTTEADNSIQE